jgi:sugar/nucleoside kinase (ribokinase family)
VIVGRRLRDRFNQPDIVVVDVHQARDDAAIFRELTGVDVLVAARVEFDRLPAAHVLHPERRHDRLQALGVHRVVVELRPAALATRHKVPAVEVEDQGARPCRPRKVD